MIKARLYTWSLGFLLGLFVAFAISNGPDCPTEDSCIADYYNGSWHIVEIVP